MSPRKQVSNLKDICTTFVSSLILENIKEHSQVCIGNCKLKKKKRISQRMKQAAVNFLKMFKCSGSKKNDRSGHYIFSSCKVLGNFRRELDIPKDLLDEIAKDVLERKFGHFKFPIRKRDYLKQSSVENLLLEFCSNSYFSVLDDTLIQVSQYDKKLQPTHVHLVHLCALFRNDETYWKKMRSKYDKVRVLELDCTFLNNDMLVKIGRNCDHLVELLGVHFSHNVTADAFHKFCFKDDKYGALQKSSCCSTLRIMEIRDYIEYCSNKISLFEGLYILLKNVSPLAFLGSYFPPDGFLQYMQSEGKELPICSLETLHLEDPYRPTQDFDIVPTMCPNLKNLIFCVYYSSDFVDLICTFQNLETLSVNTLRQEMLHRLLNNLNTTLLKKLHIDIYGQAEVNISEIALRYPALESLQFFGVTLEYDGNIPIHFENLREVTLLSTKESLFTWLPEVSATIEKIKIRRTSLFPVEPEVYLLLELFCFHYPKLKSIDVDKTSFTPEGIKAVINHCPSLMEIKSLDENLIERLEPELLQENFDVKLSVFTPDH